MPTEGLLPVWTHKNRCLGDCSLQSRKCFITALIPLVQSLIFLREISQRSCNFTKLWNKTPKELQKPDETPEICQRTWLRPRSQDLNFLGVNLDPILSDQEPEKVHFILEELTFLRRDVQFVLFESLQHSLQMTMMALFILAEHQKVIDIHNQELIDAVMEDVIHQ